jgi:signal transduction histidine kinase
LRYLPQASQPPMTTTHPTGPSADELSLIFQALPDGITVQDVEGQLIYANDAAAAISGFDSAKAMIAAGEQELARRFRFRDESGRVLAPADLPGRRAVLGEPGELLIRYQRAAGGSDAGGSEPDAGSAADHGPGPDHERWVLIRSTPVRGADRRVKFAINVLRDVTERRRSERWQHFLSEASTILASSLDYESTLQAFADRAVGTVADWCAVDLRQPDRTFRCVVVAHVDAEKVPLLRRLRDSYRLHPGEKGSAAAALRSGRVQLVADVSDQRLQAVARDAQHLQILRAVGVRSVMYVPLLSRGEVFGVITLATSHTVEHYQEQDLAVAEELSRRASVSVDNARLYAETQESLRSREDLMAIVSHDLRNPLGVVLASSALLLKSALPPDREERARRQVEAIQRAGNRMNRLIKDLLDFASIQGGRLNISPRPQDALTVTREVIEVLEPLAAQKSQQLRRELGDDLERLEIVCDRDRLIQVFSNIVGNAIKFTPDGGTIVLVAQAQGELAHFSVTDTGPGMDPEELANMFDRYWQAQRKNRDGIGLGLSIAKGIIDAHGGRIWAESQPGAGTAVHFVLPVAGPPVAGANAAVGH